MTEPPFFRRDGLKPVAYISDFAWPLTSRRCLLGHRQECLCYQDGPVTSFGRVRIHGPFAVTATVCSK